MIRGAEVTKSGWWFGGKSGALRGHVGRANRATRRPAHDCSPEIEEGCVMGLSKLVAVNRRRRRAGLLAVLAASVAAGAIGCGGSGLPCLPVYRVTGKVLLADGKPLPGGFISFVPKNGLPLTPSASIGPDGTFSVVTGGSGEGAPAGEYKVRVESPEFQRADPRSRKRALIPPKYTDEDSSGLIITVRAESNRLDPILLK
jgi:hypothetical protein